MSTNRNRCKNLQNRLVYIAEGFNEDCGTLIDVLTDNYNKVDWQIFCHHWKEMEFDKLFFGRQSGAELVELAEEFLQIARLYIVTETDNFELQVAGVFIAYALIVIQPYKDLCALRLIPDDAYPLQKIEAIARRDNRKDLLMALGKLYLYGHTQFHVSLRERSMDKSIRKYFDSDFNVPKCISRRWHGSLGRNVIRGLDKITRKESEYIRQKMIAKATAEDKIKGIEIQVDMYKPEQTSMAESLRKLTERFKEEDSKEAEDTVTAIKRKAMKLTVDPMKHLHGLSERKKNNEKIVLNPLSPSKAKARTRRLKIRSQDEDNSPPDHQDNQCMSLPALDAVIEEIRDREGSPEAAFRGFNANEIETCESYIKQPAKNCNDLPKPQKTISASSKHKVGRGKRKSATKRKRTLKNKNNKKLKVTNDFNSDSDIDTSDDYSSDETVKPPEKIHEMDDLAFIKTYKGKEPTLQTYNSEESLQTMIKTYKRKKPTLQKDINTYKGVEPTLQTDKKTYESEEPTLQTDIETYTGKALTLQTNTGAKQFVEYEVSDIVIRTEVGAQPDHDVEIEYIDNFNNGNARFEDLCDVSDDDKNKKDDNDDVEVIIQPCDVNGELNDDAIEVFEVIDSEAKEREAFVSSDEDINNEKMKHEMEKILNKDMTNKGKVDRRRKLKQPKLRSKLKRMGILPVASFKDD